MLIVFVSADIDLSENPDRMPSSLQIFSSWNSIALESSEDSVSDMLSTLSIFLFFSLCCVNLYA